MRSQRTKVLHEIANAPMLHHAMAAAQTLDPAHIVVVVGHGAAEVGEAALAFDSRAQVALQDAQLGTGHAVLSAAGALEGFEGDLFVLFGDTPFIRPETLLDMQAARRDSDLVALGFEAKDPGRYGRFVMVGESLSAIVEAKDATEEQLAIRTCNSGLMAADCATMLRLLGLVGNENAQGEYYLTDLVAVANAEGLSCKATLCDEAETMGINDRVQLAEAEAIFQARARREAMQGGVTMVAPETVFLSMDTKLGRDVMLHPNVVLARGVEIGDGCEIKAFTHLEQTRLAADVKVGPFARSRGGTDLASGVRIGNFVEMKNAQLGAGTKAGHLSYLGDAGIGAGVNIGAGTITCNYDGVRKHRTTIEDRAFIGVNTAMIAPVEIGEGAYVGTGTVVTEDVPADALALSRTPQVNREGKAVRLRKMFAERANRKEQD